MTKETAAQTLRDYLDRIGHEEVIPTVWNPSFQTPAVKVMLTFEYWEDAFDDIQEHFAYELTKLTSEAHADELLRQGREIARLNRLLHRKNAEIEALKESEAAA